MMIKIILVVGLILRLIGLDQSLWLDEATSAIVVRNLSFNQIFSQFLPGDFHPPLYYLILKIWANIFGTTEIGLRSLSVLVGVATIYVVFEISQFLKLKPVWLAPLLLATSGLHIYYSQEARMYCLAAFFVSLGIWLFLQKRWLWWGIALAGASLTHYLTLLILPIFWFFGKQNKNFYTSHNIILVSWLGWAPVFLRQLKNGLLLKTKSPLWWNILGKTSIKEIALVPTKFILGRITLDNKLLYGLVVLVLVLLFGTILSRSLKKYKEVKLIWLWLAIPFTAAALIGLKVPVFSYFRLLFILPAFYLLISHGVAKLPLLLRKPVVVLLVLINLLSSGVYLFNPRFHREDWKGLVNYLEAQKGEKDITLFVNNSQMEAYTYYAPAAKIGGPDKLSPDHDTIWLMRYVQTVFDPEDELKQKVEELGYQKQREYDFNGVVVWKYQK